MILVLGAGGSIGGHLCAALDEAGADYRAAFRTPAKLEAALGRDIEAVEVDLSRTASVRAAMQDVQRLFLLTAAAPDMAERERNAISEAVRAGVELIVKISVWEADAEGYAFARWHAPAERALAESGVAHHILRPNGFMQSLAQSMQATVRDHGAYYVADTASASAYIDARDVAACACALLTGDPPEDRSVWSPTGPEALDARAVSVCLARVIGKPVRTVEIPPDSYRNGLLAAGLPQYMVEALVEMSASTATRSFGRVTDDVQRLTGRAPRSLDVFFEEQRDAFLS